MTTLPVKAFSSFLLCGLAALVLSARSASAQTTLTWTGAAEDGIITNPGNWAPAAPTGSGTESLVFGDTPYSTIFVDLGSPPNNVLMVKALTFTSGTAPYSFNGSNSPVLKLTGDVSVTAANAAPIYFANTIGIGLIADNFDNAHTVNVATGASLIVLSPISQTGTASITKTGGGALILGGTSIFSGGVTVSGGTLGVSTSSNASGAFQSGPLGTGAVSLAAGTTLLGYDGSHMLRNAIAIAGTVTLDASYLDLQGVVSGSGRINVVANSYISLRGLNTYTGGADVAGTLAVFDDRGFGAVPASATPGSIALDSGGRLSFEEAFTINSNRGIALGAGGATFELDEDGATRYGGIIAGSGRLRIANGLLLLSGANTYTGGTEADEGGLSISSDANLGAAPASFDGDNIELLYGDLRITSTMTLGANRGILLSSYGTLRPSAGVTFTVPGAISGTGSLYIEGPGTVSLTGANTLTSLIFLNRGTLRLAAPNTLPAGARIDLGYPQAKLEIQASQTISNLYGDYGTIVLGAGSQLTIGNTSSSYSEFYGQISGAGSLRLMTGYLELYRGNSYSGGTVMHGGELYLGAGDSLGTGTLTIASGATDAQLYFDEGYTFANNVVLNAPLYIDGSEIVLAGQISGPGRLTLADEFVITGNNTYSGGTSLEWADLILGSNSPFGTGLVTSTAGFNYFSTSGPITIANALKISTANFGFYPRGSLAVTGGVTLDTVVGISGDNAYNSVTVLSGNVGESVAGAGITLYAGNLLLSGSNSYTGGTTVTQGSLVFGSAVSVPATGLLLSETGYIGAAFTANTQAGFIDRFNKASQTGSLGLDTLPGIGTQTFAFGGGSLDLTGFHADARIGSRTRAILSASIVPQGSSYRFGGGGGTLRVTAGLGDGAGSRSLNLGTSSDFLLTLELAGTNTYTGGTTVGNGALIFESVAALPPLNTDVELQTTNNFTVQSGGYIGLRLANPATAGTDAGIQSFLSRFTGGNSGFIGFDSANAATPYTLSNLDLSAFDHVRIGTTTSLTLTGTLGANASSSLYGFAGIKGGTLRVESNLSDGTGPRAVYIGDSGVGADALNGNLDGVARSTVVLAGSNTHSAGTVLASGRLVVTNPGALGKGTFYTAYGESSFAVTKSMTIGNNFSLNGYTEVDVPAGSTLNLTGSFEAGESFRYVGAGTLVLNGISYIDDLEVKAAGSGGLVSTRSTHNFDTLLSSGSLTLTAPRATLVYFRALPGTTLNLGPGTELRLEESDFYPYDTEDKIGIAATITGAGARLILDGDEATLLSGNNTFSGGVLLLEEELYLGHSNALGTGTFTVGDAFSADSGDAELTAAIPGLVLPNNVVLNSELEILVGEEPFAGNDITFAGSISGKGGLYIRDGAIVTLSGANTFTGPTYLYEGTLTISNNAALSASSLDFGGGGGTVAFTTLAPVIGGLGGDYYERAEIELAAGAALTVNQARNSEFYGTISAPGPGSSLVKAGVGRLVLGGILDVSSLVGSGGSLVLSNAGIVPATAGGALTATASGYIGVGGSGAGNLQETFVNRFNKAATTGSIGVDNVGGSGFFTSDIDLTGFSADARIGSSSFGTLTGSITPQGAAYRFGGGGGTLTLRSVLGTRPVVVSSPSLQPLTLRVENESVSTPSTFTSITAEHSAVVLKSGALPASATLALGTGGYIGTFSTNTSDFLSRFAASTSQGIIGFDGNRTVADLNLGAFSGAVYVGSASPYGYVAEVGNYVAGVVLTGTITTPNGGADPYRFAAYKSGMTEVQSILSGTRSVLIGDPASFGTIGNHAATANPSIVRLKSANTYTGNTIFYGGVLELGNTASLGTGTLVVQPNSFETLTIGESYTSGVPYTHQLSGMTSGITIANPIVVNATLSVGGYSYGLNLAGPITGGGLLLQNGNHITISGDNSGFSGGIVIDGGALTFASNTATGTGPLHIAAGTAHFTSANPVVHGLSGYNQYEDPVNLAGSGGVPTTLTINQAADDIYRGYFYENVAGGALVKTGAGRLYLRNQYSSYTGGTTINAGTIAIDSYAYSTGTYYSSLGYGSTNYLTLDGGALQYMGFEATTYVPFIVGPNGGTILADGFGAIQFYPDEDENLTMSGAGNRTLTLSGGNPDDNRINVQIGNPLVGATTLRKAGTGRWLIGDTASHSGGTIVNGGQLEIGKSQALPAAGIVINGIDADAVLNLRNYTQDAANLTFGGSLSLAGALNTVMIAPAGKLQLQGTVSYDGTGGAGAALITGGEVALGGDRTFNIGDSTAAGAELTIDSTLSGGAVSITKVGTGTLVLAGSNAYTGGTTIAAGTLVIGSQGAIGTGPLVINGGRLSLAEGLVYTGAFSFGPSGGFLGGSGTFANAFAVGPGVGLSPGASPGVMNFSAGLTLASGGSITFEIQDAAGAAGVGYDLVAVSGVLAGPGTSIDITATSAAPFFVNVVTLAANGTPGLAANFNPAAPYTWTFATAASGISGFDPTKFAPVLAGFANGVDGGTFTFGSTGTALTLNFTPVPEPSTWAMMIAGAAAMAGKFLRRRRK